MGFDEDSAQMSRGKRGPEIEAAVEEEALKRSLWV
jgi:hypothetical protein